MDFVGRKRELAELGGLHAGGARLVTLWGPGGAGKTHLARHFAASRAVRRQRPGGLVFCDLTGARTASDVLRCLATALRPEHGDVTAGMDAPEIVDRLASRPAMLVVLDNFEQVVRHASRTVGRWTAQAPQHLLLVTSREPLGLPDEACLEVGPLPEADAVRLLTAAARRGGRRRGPDTERELLARIVTRLDRLPLAIELAASRLVMLGPEELLARLDRPLELLRGSGRATARPSTLERTVRWSWDLLCAPERELLACCSVFDAGFSHRAAQGLIAPASRDEATALELLEGLCRRSLVFVEPQSSPPLLRLYEVVRAFAAERLSESGLRPAVERRHAELTLALAEAQGRDGVSDDRPALDRLAQQSADLLAIHRRFLDDEPAWAARAVLALHPLLLLRGPYELHTELLDASLRRQRVGLPAQLVARLRVARAEVLRVRGRLDEAQADVDRALRRARRGGDLALEIQALQLSGAIARMQGRMRAAVGRARAALDRARQAGDATMSAVCLGALGSALALQGRLRQAGEQHRMALDLHRALGQRGQEGMQLSHLGLATHRLGRLQEARGLHEQALAIHRELGHRRYEAAELSHLAFIQHQLGQIEMARARYREALDLCRLVCDRRLEAIVGCFFGDLETDAGEPMRARALLHEALGYHERVADLQQQAVTWLHLGYNHAAAGEPEEAAIALENASRRAGPFQHWIRAASQAHLAALLRHRGQRQRAARARRQAMAGLRLLQNPHQALAVRLLCTETPRRRQRLAVERAAACSADVRRALRWFERGAARELWIGPEAVWFSLGRQRVDLSRRGPMRRMLQALVAAQRQTPGSCIPWHGLFEAGWPGQRVDAESGGQRVYTAVWSLRRLGLDGVLQRRDEGYLLDPSLPLRLWSA